jgi:hypothetical protein
LGFRPSYTCGEDFDGLAFSKSTFDIYKAEGFDLTKLCVVLTSGAILLDPETGQRLPTYVEWQDNEIDHERLFFVPPCFARGVAWEERKEYVGWMGPIGCIVRFHPWSGRPLNKEEIEFFTKNLRILAGGPKGGETEDVENLVGGANRRELSSEKIEEIKQKQEDVNQKQSVGK